MSVCKTASRRRKQAAMGYAHMAKQMRPTYAKRSADVAARRLADTIARQRMIAARKGSKR